MIRHSLERCIPWCVKYADGGGLSPAGRQRREQVRMQAAALFEQEIKPPEDATGSVRVHAGMATEGPCCRCCCRVVSDLAPHQPILRSRSGEASWWCGSADAYWGV